MGEPKKLVKKKKVDWNAVKKDPEYKENFGWKLLPDNMVVIQDSLINRNATVPQMIAVYSQAVPENGGDPGAHGNDAFGIMGWRGPRAEGLPETLDEQIHKLMTEMYDNPKAKDWTHGGPGMGIQTGKEMYEFFQTTPVVRKAVNAFMRGYVRPPKSAYDTRQEFANYLKKFYE